MVPAIRQCIRKAPCGRHGPLTSVTGTAINPATNTDAAGHPALFVSPSQPLYFTLTTLQGRSSPMGCGDSLSGTIRQLLPWGIATSAGSSPHGSVPWIHAACPWPCDCQGPRSSRCPCALRAQQGSEQDCCGPRSRITYINRPKELCPPT